MHTKDNFGWLDRFRLIAALLVIAIHTSPLGAFTPEGDFFLTRILARIAVPFFLMVTGQFITAEFISDSPTGRRNFLHCLRKTLFLYAAAIILYLPVGIYAGHYRNLTFMSFSKMLLFDGTFYHLWYFPACLLGISLVYLMSRFITLRGMFLVSAVLYIIGLSGDSYFGLVQKLPPLEAIYNFFFQICSYTRNGLFYAPLFLVLGAWCARGSRRGLAAHLTMLFLSFLLMTAEAFTLRHFSWQRHDSMYFMLIPVMISLYRVLLCLPGTSGKAEKYFRSASLWIYMLHPIFIIIVRGIAKMLCPTPFLVDNSLIHYIAVSVLSVCAGFGTALFGKPLRSFRSRLFRSARRAEAPDVPLSRPPAPDNTEKEQCRRIADIFRRRTVSGSAPSGHGQEATRSTPIPCGRAWIELDRSALAQNVEYLCSLMPEGCRLMPAVKANAYGHGAVWVATELNRLGVDAFCVACISEGITLRKANVKGEILILGYTRPEDFGLLAYYGLTQTIIDYEYAEKLENAGIMLHVHIGIDTGMHRLGIRCEEIEDILAVFEMEHLIIDGMFTHLCACDSPLPKDKSFTADQIQAFYKVAEILEEQGIPRPGLHLQSSYGLLNYPDLNADYVRAGIALYGVPSSMKDTALFKNHFSPVLSLKARVSSIRTLFAGESAGYGLSFTAERNMRIAVLSIGYADGLPRELSCGKGCVLLHGRRAPVIGRICMDQTLIDISGIPQTSPGDTAVLIGMSGEAEITAVQLASQCGTITNELLSRLGERLERTEARNLP